MLLTTMFGIRAHGLAEGSPLREAGRGILQRYVFAVVRFVATQQLRPRLPPDTSKGISSKTDHNTRR